MHSTIHPFITELIISEEVGAAKPHPAFFDAAFARTGNPPKSDVLIIGDSLTSDMQGGVDYGIDTCWYNPAGEVKPEGFTITYRDQAFARVTGDHGLMSLRAFSPARPPRQVSRSNDRLILKSIFLCQIAHTEYLPCLL